MVSGSTFKGLLHFVFILVQVEGNDPLTLFCRQLSSFPDIFKGLCCFKSGVTVVCSCLLCHKLIHQWVRAPFWALCPVSLDYESVLEPELWYQGAPCLQFCCFSRFPWYSGCWWIHMDFRTNCSSEKKAIGFCFYLTGICCESDLLPLWLLQPRDTEPHPLICTLFSLSLPDWQSSGDRSLPSVCKFVPRYFMLFRELVKGISTFSFLDY